MTIAAGRDVTTHLQTLGAWLLARVKVNFSAVQAQADGQGMSPPQHVPYSICIQFKHVAGDKL